MTVELIPKNADVWCWGIDNNTWYEMVNKSGMKDIISHQNTNDPIDVSDNDAKECSFALREWEPSEQWFMKSITADERIMWRNKLVYFFYECGGFTTS